MKLTSTAFADGGEIPKVYTCDGLNTHPPLSFENVPNHTHSLALIMEDPDVSKERVKSGVVDHWVVFNIPPKTNHVSEGELLPGTYGVNISGQATYIGPCPPATDGEHRYFFKLYALDTQLALKKGGTKDQVLEAMDGHIIEQAGIMGKYKRLLN